MRNFAFVMAALALGLLCGQSAEAGPFRAQRRTYSQPSQPQAAQPSVVNASFEMVAGDDQTRCQQEANIMAARRFCGHVGGTIGRFEGVGEGSSPNCATCTPEQYGLRGLRLTGDAVARGANGRNYRVRSWR
jgi:hypothetical protein